MGAVARITTGSYLARRRAAAGLTPAQVDVGRGWAPGTMAEIEAQLRGTSENLTEQLHGAFPFDPQVMRRLRDGDFVRICNACGCSEWDACWDAVAEIGCYWVGSGHGAQSLCSDCQLKGIV